MPASALFEPDANHLEIEAIAPVLQQLFYELVFFPTSSNHSNRSRQSTSTASTGKD